MFRHSTAEGKTIKHHRILIGAAIALGLLVSAGAVLASTNATIRGNAKANTLRGTAGNDAIWGLGGNDKLYGGAGNDKLYGGPGDDLLVGGPGADVMSCGPGNDKVVGGPGDKAAADCEHVSGIPTSGGGGGGGDGGGGGIANPPPPKPACSDGIDNDGDGKVDYPADPGCDSASDTDETDPATPVTAGNYQGDIDGNHFYFTVTPDRTVTGFRINSVTEPCQPADLYLRGAIDWTQNTFTIGSSGSFTAQGNWTGSEKQGDAEYTAWSAQVSGTWATPTTVSGTLIISDELNYNGQHYRCSTGQVKWSATLQG